MDKRHDPGPRQGGGAFVTIRCDNIPTGLRLEDNEAGTRSSLQKLATLLECHRPSSLSEG